MKLTLIEQDVLLDVRKHGGLELEHQRLAEQANRLMLSQGELYKVLGHLLVKGEVEVPHLKDWDYGSEARR